MSTSSSGHFPLLEAIHCFDADDGRWLARIAECAAAALGFRLGAIACHVSPGADKGYALDVVRSKAVPRKLIPSWLATAADERGPVARVTLSDPERSGILIPAPPATTLQRMASRAHGGTPFASERHGDADALVIRGTTPDGRCGLLLVAPQWCAIRLSGRRQRALDRLGVQIATACRLRAALSGRDPFALAARVLLPLGAPQSPIQRRAVRVTGRKGTPEAAADLWLGLLSGRWCAVDHRDRDGKRLLLAVASPATGAAPFGLGADEREVLTRVAARQSLKHVASDLGLGASTVSARLRSAVRKLRLDSPSDAIRIFSAGLASRR